VQNQKNFPLFAGQVPDDQKRSFHMYSLNTGEYTDTVSRRICTADRECQYDDGFA
jgi:hypothetical protein